MRSWKDKYEDICKLYQNGKSAKEIANLYQCKSSNSIKQIIKKFMPLRSQSEASKLAIKQGKKNKAIEFLIQSAKTTNRFNPKKVPWTGNPELHPQWIKNRDKLSEKRSITEERHLFRDIMKERDYKCELTGVTGRMSCHHIKPVWKYPELRYGKENIIVIKHEIHKRFHNKYGWKADENMWQLFIENKEYLNALSQ